MRFFKHCLCLIPILLLPVGYYQNDGDSSNVRFDIGAGIGQYAQIFRSCSGDVLSKGSLAYADFGAGIEYRPSIGEPMVIGLRGGHLNARMPHTNQYGDLVRSGYLNPYFAIEGKNFGFGAGWLRNLGPVIDPDLFDLDLDFRKTKDVLSGHLRIGNRGSTYFITSFFEGRPIVSEYGYLMLGFGYGGSPDWHLVGGLSAGFYDGAGFCMSISHKTRHYGSPGLAFRMGSSEGELEGGISLNWSIPIH